MTDFIFAYHGGKRPASKEEGARHMADWHKWIEDLGDSMVNPGTPVGMSKTVSSAGVADDGGSNPLNGFSVVRADSMEDALKIAQSCPVLAVEGSIEVAEMMSM